MTMSVVLATAFLVGFPAAEALRLTVHPAAAPVPALQYQLLPEVRELNAGNPVHWYARCFAEQRNFFFNRGALEERTRYRTEPLSLLASRKLGGYGGSALVCCPSSACRCAAFAGSFCFVVLKRGFRFAMPTSGISPGSACSSRRFSSARSQFARISTALVVGCPC